MVVWLVAVDAVVVAATVVVAVGAAGALLGQLELATMD